MNEITMQRHAIEQRIADVDIELGAGTELITKMISLSTDPHALYKHADDEARGSLNRAFFEALYIDMFDGGIIQIGHDIQEPFGAIVGSTPRRDSVEPATSAHNENGRPDTVGTPVSRIQSALNLCSEVTGSNVFNLVDAGGLSPNTWERLERLSAAWEQAKPGIVSARPLVTEPEPGAVSNPTRRSRTPLTPEEVDAIRTARTNGESVLSIAKRFGVHRVTVWEQTKNS